MKDVELFRDSFQNFKTYQIPKAQLIIADVLTILGKTLMLAIRHGTRMETIKMEKVSLRERNSSIQKTSLDRPSLCIFVATC